MLDQRGNSCEHPASATLRARHPQPRLPRYRIVDCRNAMARIPTSRTWAADVASRSSSYSRYGPGRCAERRTAKAANSLGLLDSVWRGIAMPKDDLDEFRGVLRRCWSEETSLQWLPENPARGEAFAGAAPERDQTLAARVSRIVVSRIETFATGRTCCL